MNERIAVIVTTEFKGVFYGLTTDAKDARVMTLEDARNVIYWSGTEGFLRLAATGPVQGDRIGAKAPEITLQGVTSVVKVSADARAKWETL